MPYAFDDFLADRDVSDRTASRVTSVAAKVCGVADRKGRLAEGFDADLLAVAGDPFTNPAVIHDVAGVWRAGSRVT